MWTNTLPHNQNRVGVCVLCICTNASCSVAPVLDRSRERNSHDRHQDASKLFGEERVKEILETKSRFDKNFESDKDYISDKFHYVICHSRNGSVVAHSPTIKDMEPTRIENIL